MSEPQQRATTKPPPPPGYHDADAVAAKPAPPAGYHDVDAQQDSSLLDKASSPLLSGDTVLKLLTFGLSDSIKKHLQGAQDYATANNQPLLAGVSQFEKGAMGDFGNVGSSMTSPASLAMILASGGTGPAAKAIQAGGSALFGAQGAKQAITPQQEGEAPVDAMQRRLMGAGTALGGGAGLSDSVRGAMPKTSTVQNVLGVGEGMTRDAVAARDTKIASGDAKYQQKVSTAQRANEQSKADFQQRQQLTDEASGHAKELAQHLPQLAEQERAFAKALYPEIEGSVAPKELMGKVQDAIESNIRGTDKVPTALKKVVDAVTPEDPLSQASVFRGSGSQNRGVGPRGVSLDELPPAARAKVMKDLSPDERAMYEAPEPKGASGISFDKLHGMYSELGQELSRDLPGDERAAVTQTRATILDSMRKLAESENKLSQFTDAQKNWSQYENTFNKTWSDKRGVASPVAKALQAKNPVTGEILPERVQQLLSKDNNYKLAQDLLGKYKGAKTDVLQLMKEKLDQAAGLPKTLKQTPMPEPPAAPPEVDAQKLKADALSKKADMLGGFSGRGMFIDTASLLHFLTTGNPVALSIPIGRRLAAKAIRSGAEGGLTHLTPNEVQMLKPKQVYPSSTAAKAAAKTSGMESDMEAARRGAPGIDPKLKSIRRQFEKDKK